MAFKQSPSLCNNTIYSYQLLDLYSVVRCICVLLCHFEGCFPVQNYLCIADGAVLASSLKYEASFLCLSKIFTHGRIHRLLSTTSTQLSHSADKEIDNLRAILMSLLPPSYYNNKIKSNNNNNQNNNNDGNNNKDYRKMKKHRKIEMTATTKLKQISNLKAQSSPCLKYTILEWKRANGLH